MLITHFCANGYSINRFYHCAQCVLQQKRIIKERRKRRNARKYFYREEEEEKNRPNQWILYSNEYLLYRKAYKQLDYFPIVDWICSHTRIQTLVRTYCRVIRCLNNDDNTTARTHNWKESTLVCCIYSAHVILTCIFF